MLNHIVTLWLLGRSWLCSGPFGFTLLHHLQFRIRAQGGEATSGLIISTAGVCVCEFKCNWVWCCMWVTARIQEATEKSCVCNEWIFLSGHSKYILLQWFLALRESKRTEMFGLLGYLSGKKLSLMFCFTLNLNKLHPCFQKKWNAMINKPLQLLFKLKKVQIQHGWFFLKNLCSFCIWCQ